MSEANGPVYNLDFDKIAEEIAAKERSRQLKTHDVLVDSIVETKFTDEDYANARQWAEELGVLNNSILKGRGNVMGRIGEIVVARYTGGQIVDKFSHDILLPDGRTLEVKSKGTSLRQKPLLHYENAVSKLNDRQQADFYAFTRINMSTKQVWLLGMLSKDAFKEKSRVVEKGFTDVATNFVARESYNAIKIGLLQPLPEAIA